MRVKIVSGNDAGSIREYDASAAQSLLDSGFAVPVPPGAPKAALTPAPEPEPASTVAEPEPAATTEEQPRRRRL